MVRRCYDPKAPNFKSYGAKGIYVEEYLLNFSNYVSFVSQLPHYDDLLKNPSEWQIDKDIKGGKCYSRDTMQIVPKRQNLKFENDAKKIPIFRIMENGEYEYFESITEAEKITGIYRGNIARAVRNNKTAGGYAWRCSHDTTLH